MKSGFVVLVGRSNVGKSTLLNTLVGTKISAVTHKPQTTRHAIQGVLHAPEGQIVFVDTPGVFKEVSGALSKVLTKTVEDALEGVDALLYVVDPSRAIGAEERATLAMIRVLTIPKLLVINKSDLPDEKKEYLEEYRALAPDFDGIFEVSAIRASHVQPVIEQLFAVLPEGEPTYPEGQKTNITDYFWVAETIREKIFLYLDDELPYATHVEVESMEEKGERLVIVAHILTSEERYKKMLIGIGGKKIKEIGTSARAELEAATNKKIFLDLEVVVDPHWVERLAA